MPTRTRGRPAQRLPELGDIIEIYWPKDSVYYRGRLDRRLPGDPPSFRIVYDDGDKEHVTLSKEIWRFAKAPTKRGRPSVATPVVPSPKRSKTPTNTNGGNKPSSSKREQSRRQTRSTVSSTLDTLRPSPPPSVTAHRHHRDSVPAAAFPPSAASPAPLSSNTIPLASTPAAGSSKSPIVPATSATLSGRMVLSDMVAAAGPPSKSPTVKPTLTTSIPVTSTPADMPGPVVLASPPTPPAIVRGARPFARPPFSTSLDPSVTRSSVRPSKVVASSTMLDSTQSTPLQSIGQSAAPIGSTAALTRANTDVTPTVVPNGPAAVRRRPRRRPRPDQGMPPPSTPSVTPSVPLPHKNTPPTAHHGQLVATPSLSRDPLPASTPQPSAIVDLPPSAKSVPTGTSLSRAVRPAVQVLPSAVLPPPGPLSMRASETLVVAPSQPMAELSASQPTGSGLGSGPSPNNLVTQPGIIPSSQTAMPDPSFVSMTRHFQQMTDELARLKAEVSSITNGVAAVDNVLQRMMGDLMSQFRDVRSDLGMLREETRSSLCSLFDTLSQVHLFTRSQVTRPAFLGHTNVQHPSYPPPPSQHMVPYNLVNANGLRHSIPQVDLSLGTVGEMGLPIPRNNPLMPPQPHIPSHRIEGISQLSPSPLRTGPGAGATFPPPPPPLPQLQSTTGSVPQDGEVEEEIEDGGNAMDLEDPEPDDVRETAGVSSGHRFLDGKHPAAGFPSRVFNLVARQMTVCLLETPHENVAGLDLEAWAKNTSYCAYVKVAERLGQFQSYSQAYHILSTGLGTDSVELAWFTRPWVVQVVTRARRNYAAWDPPPSDDEWHSEMVLLTEVGNACHHVAGNFRMITEQTEVEAAVTLAKMAVEMYRKQGINGEALAAGMQAKWIPTSLIA